MITDWKWKNIVTTKNKFTRKSTRFDRIEQNARVASSLWQTTRKKYWSHYYGNDTIRPEGKTRLSNNNLRRFLRQLGGAIASNTRKRNSLAQQRAPISLKRATTRDRVSHLPTQLWIGGAHHSSHSVERRAPKRDDNINNGTCDRRTRAHVARIACGCVLVTKSRFIARVSRMCWCVSGRAFAHSPDAWDRWARDGRESICAYLNRRNCVLATGNGQFASFALSSSCNWSRNSIRCNENIFHIVKMNLKTLIWCSLAMVELLTN